jgi:hypothetical protein
MNPVVVRMIGQIVISVASLAMMGYMIHHVSDEGTQKLLAGAVMGFATATVQFWVGSSMGSQSKDSTIAASYPPGVAPPPVVGVVPVVPPAP